jgi:hypothetical protein
VEARLILGGFYVTGTGWADGSYLSQLSYRDLGLDPVSYADERRISTNKFSIKGVKGGQAYVPYSFF